jgi:hypothetical protein
VKGVPLGRHRVEEEGPACRVRVSPSSDTPSAWRVRVSTPAPPPGSALMMAAASATPHICKRGDEYVEAVQKIYVHCTLGWSNFDIFTKTGDAREFLGDK